MLSDPKPRLLMNPQRKQQLSKDSEIRRQSTRLQDWDYSAPAAYFVTICAYQRELLFGKVVDDQMVINDFGQIVDEEWSRSVDIRKELDLDDYVVMPNHLHGIVILQYTDAIGRQPSHRASVDTMLG